MALRLPLALAAGGALQVALTDLVYTGWLPNPQGRLTLTSGVPVLVSTVSGAPSVIYTPYLGNLIPVWNGAAFVPVTFAEVSQALSDTTKSPSAAVAGNVYDVFGWMDGATFRVTRGPAWSAGTAGSNTVRGAGVGSTALTRVQGLLVNAVAITNGPAAGFGTYLGTIATDAGAATVSFNPGGIGAGGVAAVVGLWNMYNRVQAGGSVRDTTASWTYSTAATWRAPNGNAMMRVTFVCGQAENEWSAEYSGLVLPSSTGAACTGVGFNSTTTYQGTTGYVPSGAGISQARGCASAVAVGLNYLSAIELTVAGTMTGYGTNGAGGYIISGLNWSGWF